MSIYFNLILCLSSLSFYFVIISGDVCKIELDSDKIVNKVEDFFISYCIDSKMFDPDEHWDKFDFRSVKLHTLIDGLFPSILRIGGSPADYSFFDLPVGTLDASGIQPKPYVITKEDVTNLLHLTSSTNTKLLFDFNVQVRFGYNWDPSNAIQLLDFAKQFLNGTHLLFELGNEPDCMLPDLITPERLGEDFAILQKVLSYYQSKEMYKTSFIVGPDVVSMNGLELQYITSYYFRGDVATYKDYLNPQNFANLAESINNVKQAVSRSKYPATDVWIGETSDAWHSGTPNVSDRFVSAFLWLDKLGLSALMGAKAVMRQTLYGYYYSLLDLDMNPNPDYWLSWLHKKLVGSSVLSLKLSCNAGSYDSNGVNLVRLFEDNDENRENDVTTYSTMTAENDPYVPYNCAKHSVKVNKKNNHNNYNNSNNNNKKKNKENNKNDIGNNIKKSAYDTSKNADSILRFGESKLNNASSSLLTFRMYAHCTQYSSMYGSGSITLYGLNLDPAKSVDVKFVGIFKNLNRHVYLMEPDNDYEEDKEENRDGEEKYSHKNVPILSKYCKLNGRRMMMVSDRGMPGLNPLHQSADQTFTLPPLTYAFIVFYDAKHASCM